MEESVTIPYILLKNILTKYLKRRTVKVKRKNKIFLCFIIINKKMPLFNLYCQHSDSTMYRKIQVSLFTALKPYL